MRSTSDYSHPPCIYNRTCRAVHIPHQVPMDWALPAYGYMMPIIVSVTFATNSFIVMVLSHKYLRTPTNYVLLAMALSELFTGLSCMPWFTYYFTMKGYEVDIEDGLPEFWCSVMPYMASFLPSIFHTMAIWLTVYLAIQRYIYICVPTLVRKFCTMGRSKQAIGENVYYHVTFSMQTIIVHFVPCVLLVIFTWKLVAAIREADKRHSNLLAKSQNPLNRSSSARQKLSEASTGDTENRLLRLFKQRESMSEPKRVHGLKQNTRMLVVVIFLFLITEIPAATIFMVHVLAMSFRLHINYHILNILLIIRNVLIVVSYPFRFAIYCGMSQQFREVVKQMFMGKMIGSKAIRDRDNSTTVALVQTVNESSMDKRQSVVMCAINGNLSATVATNENRTEEGSKKDKAVQCDVAEDDNQIPFDPFLSDLRFLTETHGPPVSYKINDKQRSCSTQCRTQIDNRIYVKRKSSLLRSALRDSAAMQAVVATVGAGSPSHL